MYLLNKILIAFLMTDKQSKSRAFMILMCLIAFSIDIFITFYELFYSLLNFVFFSLKNFWEILKDTCKDWKQFEKIQIKWLYIFLIQSFNALFLLQSFRNLCLYFLELLCVILSQKFCIFFIQIYSLDCLRIKCLLCLKNLI